MVNITHKSSTLRRAVAEAVVRVSEPSTMDAVKSGTVPKGNVLEFSRAAGLLACKKTYEVIPDCHPLPVEYASISYVLEDLAIRITVEIHTVYKTGVEVEAMHGAAITALTLYDMLKPIDAGIVIGDIRLVSKQGGKSDIKHAYPEDLPVAIITVNDQVNSGAAPDKAGDTIEKHLKRHGLKNIRRVSSGESAEAISDIARKLMSEGVLLLLFAGGSGLQPADHTPDVVRSLIDREVPSIMETIRSYGQQRTPYAMLARGVAGFSAKSLLITLPGSPRGAEESMEAVFPYILHVFRTKNPVD